MKPELRERLIALLEDPAVSQALTAFCGEVDGEVCASCEAPAQFSQTDGYVVEQHDPDCELAACLRELRAMQATPYTFKLTPEAHAQIKASLAKMEPGQLINWPPRDDDDR